MPTCGKYKIKKKLGEGGFSSVFLAKHQITSQKAALKILKPPLSESLTPSEIYKEGIILKELSHPNILQMYEDGEMELTSRGKTNMVYCTVLELARGGELFDYILHSGPFSEDICRYYFQKLVEALEYIHSQGISHRDLKLENVLLDKEFNLKLADFGYGSLEGSNVSLAGTFEYMAPEVLAKKKYSGQAVDLFGIGIILFMMRAASRPFGKAKSTDMYYKEIILNRSKVFWSIHSKGERRNHFSKEFQHLVTNLFSLNPCHRFSISEIKQHPWYLGPVPSHDEIIEEFTLRKSQTEERLKAERSSDVTYSEFNMKLIEDRCVHRGVSTNEGEDIITPVTREIEEYDSDFPNPFCFFSTSELDSLWMILSEFIYNKSGEFSVSEEEYSITAEILETEEEKDQSGCKYKFIASITEVPEQEKYCIELVVLQGDKLRFKPHYEEMINSFGGHINTSIDEE